MPMANIQLYEGYPITFEKKNGKMMVNATQMAKAFGKKPSDWLRTEQANRIIDAVSASQKCEPTDLVVVINGGDGYGSWMHEDVALPFAQWLSPEFYIWCNDHIKELLRTGSTSISLPTDYESALEQLLVKVKENNPISK